MGLVLVAYAVSVQKKRIILVCHVDPVIKGTVATLTIPDVVHASSPSSSPSPLPISTPSPAFFSTNSSLTVTPTTNFSSNSNNNSAKNGMGLAGQTEVTACNNSDVLIYNLLI